MSSLTVFECPIVVERGNMKSCWSCHLGLYWDAILGCANGVLKSQEICVYIYIHISTSPFLSRFCCLHGFIAVSISVPVLYSFHLRQKVCEKKTR